MKYEQRKLLLLFLEESYQDTKLAALLAITCYLLAILAGTVSVLWSAIPALLGSLFLVVAGTCYSRYLELNRNWKQAGGTPSWR